MVGWLVTREVTDSWDSTKTNLQSALLKTRHDAKLWLDYNGSVQFCGPAKKFYYALNLSKPLAEHLIAQSHARYSLYARKNYWDWRHRDHVQYRARVSELYELSKTKPVRIEF